MGAKQVEFLEEASAEFKAAFLWYLERNSKVASEFADSLTRAIQAIAEAPQRWPIHLGGTRKFVMRRFPFVIVYREAASAVRIVAVAHAKRKPGYWTRRL